MNMLDQRMKFALQKRTSTPKNHPPLRNPFWLAAVVVALGFLLVWVAQHILQAGLAVR